MPQEPANNVVTPEPAIGSNLDVDVAEARNEVFTHVKPAKPYAFNLSVYADDEWDLRVLEPKRAAARYTRIQFQIFPPEFSASAKRLAWTWINLSTPVERLGRPSGARLRLSPKTICDRLRYEVAPFLRHLSQRGVKSLSQTSEADFSSFLRWVNEQNWARAQAGRQLFTITRIWLSSVYLPASDRLPMPSWEAEGVNQVLGKEVRPPENRTQPIHPETMSQLLVWALRFTEDFADDIIGAYDYVQNLKASKPRFTLQEGFAIVREHLAEISAAGAPLPGYSWRGRTLFAREFVTKSLGVPIDSIPLDVLSGAQMGQTAPLPFNVLGHIEGEDQPWLAAIDYYEVSRLRSLLATACLIVTTYLSGMRGNEVAELRRGCCKKLATGDEGPPRFAVTGFQFKGALDDAGNRILGGVERETPWIVIAPVAHAIHVAERLTNSSMVFDSGAFNTSGPSVVGEAKLTSILSGRIRDFVAWINAFCDTSGRHQHKIPTDPAGAVSLTRFRRTLAWFIYRQPHGRVALGIQYGQLIPGTIDGYGSRTVSGIRGLYPMEEALAVVDRLSDAAERLEAGEHVSGPAATRYLQGVRVFAKHFRGKHLTPRQMSALLNTTSLRIFDNGFQPVACCYDVTKALCHPSRRRPKADTTPDLTRCSPNCGNVARTDKHIAAIRDELAELVLEAESPVTPEPLRQRAQQRMQGLTKLIENHESTKDNS